MTINGMADKKVVPKAANFLSIRLNTAIIIHKNTIETAAVTAPTEKTSFVFNKMPNKNKKGTIKTLNDTKLTINPLFPKIILGKDITHANIIELTGMNDHVKLPDIAFQSLSGSSFFSFRLKRYAWLYLTVLTPNSAFQQTTFLLIGRILSSRDGGLLPWVQILFQVISQSNMFGSDESIQS